jgi:hypothetical protein
MLSSEGGPHAGGMIRGQYFELARRSIMEINLLVQIAVGNFGIKPV